MGFPSSDPITLGMARMFGALIDNFELDRRKIGPQNGSNPFTPVHNSSRHPGRIECCQLKPSAHIRAMISSTRKARAYAPDPNAPGHACDAPDCAAQGEYRAPKSRFNSKSFYWFCLQHVREYNASWDYYKGMSPREIEAELRADTAWQRPSWPLGRLGQTSRLDEAVRNELNAYAFYPRAKPASAPPVPAGLRDSLNILGLNWPVTLSAVKAKYKELAKRLHPDANNGDKSSEEALKTINLAYATLRGKLSVKTPPDMSHRTS